MRNSQNYVVSPLVSYSASLDDSEQLAQDLAQELHDIARDEYEPTHTSENLPLYDFEDSIDSGNPDWWRPQIATATTRDDNSVREWYEEALSDIRDNDYFRVSEHEGEVDPLTGNTPEIEIYVDDREELSGTVSLRGGIEEICVPTQRAVNLLAGEVTSRDYDHSQVPTYSTEINEMDIEVEPDLSSGFFQGTADLGPISKSSKVWMPYADRNEAVLISMPNEFNDNQLETDIVPVADQSFTGNPITDAVAESLTYFLPFEGLPQTETSPEAIDYRSDNRLGKEPYKTRIQGNAWSKLGELDPEIHDKFMQKVDEIAMRPDKSPLDKRGDTNIDQIMGEDFYIGWQADRETERLNVETILERHEAFRKGSNKKRK